jgi:hypothetical protein
MTHVLREDLIRWRDHGLAEDRERVLAHLATCKACAQAYAELVRTAPLRQTPQRFDPADFVKRGYAVRRTGAGRWAGAVTSWKTWAIALSAAAVVLLAVSTGLRSGPDVGDTSRGGKIELVSPSRPTTNISELEWRSGLAPARFRVELADPTGTVVFRAETDATRLAVPPDVQAKLRSAALCRYTITALDRDGQSVASSSGTIAFAQPTR